MKKIIIILLCIFTTILVALYTFYQSRQNEHSAVESFNQQYEKYFDKELYGKDVVTLINKAMDNNAKYDISKSVNGKYIEDEKYCLKVLIKFKDVENVYEMESIDKAGISGFISNFRDSIFKIKDYGYNKETNRIGKIVVEEVEIGNI